MTRLSGQKGLRAAVAVMALAFLAACCGMAGEARRKRINSVADLNGMRLAILAGSSFDNAANDALDFTQILYFDNTAQEIEALMAGEVDAMIEDEPVARYLAGIDTRLRRVDGILVAEDYGFAVHPEQADLHELVNNALKEIIRDGTLKDMEERWLDSHDEATRVIPELPKAGTDGVLHLGVSSISAPFCYLKDGKVTGLDIELMERLARRIDRRLVVVDMEFSELIPSLLAGDVDVIGSCFSITPERAKVVRFTDSYYKGGVAALVLADGFIPVSMPNPDF